ncbi:UDP-3-O-acyl-N-acetylglucosamine deacetylase [Prochlorococcus marinus]|uniref:UDP-3-O-acyl-N-acetylglucosamine deacetylase n=1 Tax=Prochlorococcus marinus TaxID=1219 RepID=UPI0022B5672C|nr:UDP-3-O-acyl-N-acetylglucosamine deacetylase [Prochlorococcus marinus]
MEWLPQDYEGAWTLGGNVCRRGVGLHSGNESEVTLLPIEERGFHVSWINSDEPPITLNPSHVVNSQLCTSIHLGNKKLLTVEHLLAALVGCGLTHVHILVSGNEIPLLDGSAIEWVNAIRDVGLVSAKTSRLPCPVIQEPFVLSKGSSLITVTPSKTCNLIGIIDFPYPAIGSQVLSLELTPKTFVKQIAPARTFGFKDQIESLVNAGLIKGGSLNNALVCDGHTWLNPPLRFKDEPIRHKLLDLIGDLAFVGLPKAQILVYRGSHELHAQLANLLFQKSSSI